MSIEDEGRIAMALHDIDHIRGPMREGVGVFRAFYQAMEKDRDWQPMDTAPTDGTVIEVVGRYPTATAGFPQYVGYHDGKWWRHSRNAPEEIIPWAWRPRSDWPDETDPAFALNEEG